MNSVCGRCGDAGGAGGDALGATLYASGECELCLLEGMRCVRLCMLEAVECVVCSMEGAGGAGGDVLCTTLYVGGCGECAPSLEVPKVVRCVLLCMLEVVKGSLCCRRCRR